MRMERRRYFLFKRNCIYAEKQLLLKVVSEKQVYYISLSEMSNYIESNKLSCYNASMLRIRQFE